VQAVLGEVLVVAARLDADQPQKAEHQKGAALQQTLLEVAETGPGANVMVTNFDKFCTFGQNMAILYDYDWYAYYFK
jgi:hypothetical protein